MGDTVVMLIDDTADNGNPSNIALRVVADTANGNFQKTWPQGKVFSTGIFYKEGSAADVITELTAK